VITGVTEIMIDYLILVALVKNCKQSLCKDINFAFYWGL